VCVRSRWSSVSVGTERDGFSPRLFVASGGSVLFVSSHGNVTTVRASAVSCVSPRCPCDTATGGKTSTMKEDYHGNLLLM
jgi:hypothetical protein